MKAAGTAFASDYDGTLCESDWDTGTEKFDPADLDAIRRYQAAGGLFGICTGRQLGSIQRSLAGVLDLDFYIVTTGAEVADREGKALFLATVDRDLAQQLYDRYASDTMACLAVTVQDAIAIGRPFGPMLPWVESFADVEGELLGVSFECHGNEPAARAAKEDMNARFGDVIEGFQNLGSVDVVPRGCSKGAGVHFVREAFGVNRIAGIGDSYNDLPLLAAADASYTFHKAPAEVQAAADHVVGSIAEALADFAGI